MKVLISTLAASFAMAMLAGCTTAAKPETVELGHQLPAQTRLVFVDVNGRTVPCVIFDGGRAGGISCDWSVK